MEVIYLLAAVLSRAFWNTSFRARGVTPRLRANPRPAVPAAMLAFSYLRRRALHPRLEGEPPGKYVSKREAAKPG